MFEYSYVDGTGRTYSGSGKKRIEITDVTFEDNSSGGRGGLCFCFGFWFMHDMYRLDVYI